MEWGRVKNILIVLLLCVNIFLGVNIYSQLSSRRSAEADAVVSVSQTLSENGIYINAQRILALSEQSYSFTSRRDPAAERRFAEALIGSAEPYDPGGGILSFRSEAGEVNLRRGGGIDAVLNGVSPAENAGEYFFALLSSAGLDIAGAEAEAVDGRVTFRQKLNDLGTVSNAELTCYFVGGSAHISGRWLLAPSPVRHVRVPERHELMLALSEIMRQKGDNVLTSAAESFYIASFSKDEIEIIPVWIVHLSKETFIFDIANKQLLEN